LRKEVKNLKKKITYVHRFVWFTPLKKLKFLKSVMPPPNYHKWLD
jgi:hypothetical protein